VYLSPEEVILIAETTIILQGDSMDKSELIRFINEDDQTILSEQQLEEARKLAEETRKQTALLTTIVEQTKPPPDSGLNNWMTVLKLDLNTAHESYEIWKWYEGDPTVNSIVVPSQEVDFEYEIEPGKRVSIDAGLIMDISGHKIKMMRISHTDVIDDVMDVILSGYDPTKPV